MRAAIVDPSQRTISIADVPDPVPGASEVLVRVRAAGLNRSDVTRRDGVHRTEVGAVDSDSARAMAAAPAPRFVGGAELAGEVVGVDDAVTQWCVGDRVMALGAGFAELAVVDQDLVMASPPTFTWEQAGALPATLLTAHEALRTKARMQSGETVLVQAATSGVGMTAIAVAGTIGARVIMATSRSAAKLAVLVEVFDRLGDLVVPIDFFGRRCTGRRARRDRRPRCGCDLGQHRGVGIREQYSLRGVRRAAGAHRSCRWAPR